MQLTPAEYSAKYDAALEELRSSAYVLHTFLENASAQGQYHQHMTGHDEKRVANVVAAVNRNYRAFKALDKAEVLF